MVLRIIGCKYAMLDDEYVHKLFNDLIYKICTLIRDYFNQISKLNNNVFIKEFYHHLGYIGCWYVCFIPF